MISAFFCIGDNITSTLLLLLLCRSLVVISVTPATNMSIIIIIGVGVGFLVTQSQLCHIVLNHLHSLYYACPSFPWPLIGNTVISSREQAEGDMEEAEVHCRELLRRCEENFTISTLESFGEWRREWKGRCFQLAIQLMIPTRETAPIKHQISMRLLKSPNPGHAGHASKRSLADFASLGRGPGLAGLKC